MLCLQTKSFLTMYWRTLIKKPLHPQKSLLWACPPPPSPTVLLPCLYFFLFADGFSRLFGGVHIFRDLQDDVLIIGVQCHYRGAGNGLHVLCTETHYQQQYQITRLLPSDPFWLWTHRTHHKHQTRTSKSGTHHWFSQAAQELFTGFWHLLIIWYKLICALV